MKKSHIVLLIFSIITTIITIFAFTYSSLFFGVFAGGEEEGKAAAEVFGIIFFIIFDFFTMGAAVVNFALNLVQLIKTKKVYAIIMFVLAALLLIASVGMFIYLVIVR